MKNQTTYQQGFFHDIREERNHILSQIGFYLDRKGILSSNTEKAFSSLKLLIEADCYGLAVGTVEGLRLSRADKHTLHYLPAKWLCVLRVLKRTVAAGKTQRASLRADIEAEVAETLGMWAPLGSGCYSLANPHPDIPHPESPRSMKFR